MSDLVAGQPQGFKFYQVVEDAGVDGGNVAVRQYQALQDRHTPETVVLQGALAHLEKQEVREVGGQAEGGNVRHVAPGALRGVPEQTLAGGRAGEGLGAQQREQRTGQREQRAQRGAPPHV